MFFTRKGLAAETVRTKPSAKSAATICKVKPAQANAKKETKSSVPKTISLTKSM